MFFTFNRLYVYAGRKTWIGEIAHETVSQKMLSSKFMICVFVGEIQNSKRKEQAVQKEMEMG